MYDTSLRSLSKTSILPNRPCPGKVPVASPSCKSSCNQYENGYTFNKLHVQTPPYCCCMQRTVMGGACKTFQRGHRQACYGTQPALKLQSREYSGRNICHCCLENPCSIINAGSCNGSLEVWWPHDDGSSHIYSTTCHSGVDVIPLTFLQNFQEDVMVGNQGINNCFNTIPQFYSIQPIEPFDVSKEIDLDSSVLLSESFVEKVADGISVVVGKGQEEEIADNSTNLLNQKNTVLHPELDNDFPAGSYELEEENEWLMDFIAQGEEGKNRANGAKNTISGTKLEPYDFHWWEAPTNSGIDANHVDNDVGENVGAFQGDCNVNNIANQ